MNYHLKTLGYRKETRCIVFTDLSGFTKYSLDHGIESALLRLNELRNELVLCTKTYNGLIIKTIGDSLFMTFKTVKSALLAVEEMQKVTEIHNRKDMYEVPFYLCAGIGYGECFIDQHGDCYGHEVNYASKLGEDLAKANEILITEKAYDQMKEESLEGVVLNEDKYRISGVQINAYCYKGNK